MGKLFRKILAILLISAIFVLNFRVSNVFSAAPNVNMFVEDVFWGTPPNNVISVQPGDVNVPLTVIIHNNSNDTLRGVVGILNLTYPFRDYKTEGNQSRASGQPLQAGDVFNQTGDILPAGSFSLTFYLNIDSDAKKGVYSLNLTVYYSVKVGDVFINGEPKVFKIDVVLNNRAPVIYSINPSSTTISLLVGESANFSVKARDPDDDPIEIEWFLNGESVGFGENYTFYATEDLLGANTLEARVSDGNLTTSNIWTINVARRVNTTIVASTKYVFGGKKNIIKINISNNIWFGTVNINVGVSQGLVLLSDSSYTFQNVTSGDILVLNIEIFAPETLIGQSGAITIGLNYRDSNGNQYGENYVIGLVIRGIISLKVYQISVNPANPTPGSEVSISGTLLNVGNVAAKYVNVSILNTSIFKPVLEPFVYVGDVDANSPTPFTITGYIDLGVNPGEYTIVFLVKYLDELYEEHSFTFTVKLIVIQQSSQGASESSSSGGSEQFLLIGLGVATALSILVIYIRRRR